MELKIRNRSRIMQLLALGMFLTLMWAYAQIEWGPPNTIRTQTETLRGRILASDGSVLARTVKTGEGSKAAVSRVYPQGALAGQVLGMLGTEGGLEGIELAYNDQLGAGRDVKLTLDPMVQTTAEMALARSVQQHRAQYGGVIVIETRTGRILAAANYPAFDPAQWRKFSAETRRNRTFVDFFEPGSTMKALTVAAAINDGTTTPTTTYSTPMSRHVGGRWGNTINDVVDHPSILTTQQVLRYSSNVGMSHLVEKFSYQRLHDYLTAYGFGQAVDLPAVSTTRGLIKPLDKWNDLERATNSFGQGVSGSLLQLAAAFNTVGNDGLYLSPRLVEGVPAGQSREVLTPAAARTTRAMLQNVIEEGIFHAAGIKGYPLGGKTGTAQVATAQGYSATLYNSTFAGFIPADSPRVTVAVMVHGPQGQIHGSQVAAPIYRDIAVRLLSEWGAPPREVAADGK